jgi:hypothetical protein
MANLIAWLKFSGARLVTGLPVSSGYARFYVPGSDVAVDLYSDAAETEPLAQPVTLDAAGRATVYCGEQCDIVVTTSTGAAVGTGDNANVVDAEQVHTTWGGSPSTLDATLTTIEAGLAGGGAAVTASASAAPSFEFDPTEHVNVFCCTYDGEVTGITLTWPAPAPTLAAGTRYTLIFQFSSDSAPAAAFAFTDGANVQQASRTLEVAIGDALLSPGDAATFCADFCITSGGKLQQTTEWSFIDAALWSV